MLLYHYAFGLRHLLHWALPPERAHPWYTLELPLCDPLPPIQYISTNLSPEAQSHPSISHLQWKRMTIIFKFDANLHNTASIWANPKLCIGKSPFLWRSWVDRGILVLGDLYGGHTFMSFSDINTPFQLPRNQFWRYLQLRHLLLYTFGSFAPPIGFLTQILKIFGKGHEASAYYSMI